MRGLHSSPGTVTWVPWDEVLSFGTSLSPPLEMGWLTRRPPSSSHIWWQYTLDSMASSDSPFSLKEIESATDTKGSTGIPGCLFQSRKTPGPVQMSMGQELMNLQHSRGHGRMLSLKIHWQQLSSPPLSYKGNDDQLVGFSSTQALVPRWRWWGLLHPKRNPSFFLP